MSTFVPYAIGICYASVCTDLPDDEAAEALNAKLPTGISSTWQLAADETFADGQPNPCPCPDTPGCRHLLFEC